MAKYLHEINEKLIPVTHREKIEQAAENYTPKIKQPPKYVGMPDLDKNLTHSFYRDFRSRKEYADNVSASSRVISRRIKKCE